jgi:hypothetical protein
MIIGTHTIRARAILGAAFIALWPHPDLAQAVLALRTAPLLDIPDMTGASVNFRLPVAGARLRDGSLLVLDQRSHDVRLFDASGRLVRSTGDLGETDKGAGGGLMSAARCGARDSLVVWDRRLHRVAVISPEGAVARRFTIQSAPAGLEPWLDMTCTAGQFLVYASEPQLEWLGKPTTVGVSKTVIADLNGHAAVLADAGPALSEWVGTTSPTGMLSRFPRPLGSSTYLAAYGNNLIVAGSASPDLCIMQPSSPDRQAPSNSPASSSRCMQRFTLPLKARAADSLSFRAAARVIAAGAFSQQMADAVLSQLLGTERPAMLPYINSVYAGMDSVIWIQTSPPGAAPIELLGVNRLGQPTARLRVPLSRIFEIGPGYVLGTSNRDDDSVHLLLLEVASATERSH